MTTSTAAGLSGGARLQALLQTPAAVCLVLSAAGGVSNGIEINNFLLFSWHGRYDDFNYPELLI
jgi:hypothetical protein